MKPERRREKSAGKVFSFSPAGRRGKPRLRGGGEAPQPEPRTPVPRQTQWSQRGGRAGAGPLPHPLPPPQRLHKLRKRPLMLREQARHIKDRLPIRRHRSQQPRQDAPKPIETLHKPTSLTNRPYSTTTPPPTQTARCLKRQKPKHLTHTYARTMRDYEL